MERNENNGSNGMKQPHHSENVKILMLHRVVKEERAAEKLWFCLHVKKFRRVLELLDQWGYVPITMEDYRMYRNDQLALPRRPVILTFDDGYADTYENAFPLLDEYGMKAVVFALGDRTIQYSVWDKHLNGEVARLLNDHQILEMSEAGFEIGAHSMTHARLTQLEKDSVWYEVAQSRVLLEILLNKPVRTFSYPYGLVNDSVKQLVRYAGFSHACSVWSGPASFGTDNYELRRVPILNTTNEFDLMVKLSSPYQYYRWLVWKTKNKISAPDRLCGDSGRYDAAPAFDRIDEEVKV